jgi:high-affinity iron transporter
MFQSFVITLREGLEAFLIVAISLAFLRKSGRAALAGAVRWGTLAAIAISVAAGVALGRAANQSFWEAVLALAAAVLVGTLIVHMWRAARTMRRTIENRLAVSTGKTGPAAYWGVFLFTVFMITREGMETALLINALLFQVKSVSLAAGAIMGLACAAVLAWAWSRWGNRINLGRFLQVTAVFLSVFVVQLVIYGFHELTESGVLPAAERWHAATEPFGPDGFYGHLLSYGLVALPLAWLLVAWLKDQRRLIDPASAK